MKSGLTVWQNFIIPNIHEAALETVKEEILRAGFNWKQSNLSSGVIACTGNTYCKFSVTDTKGHALALIEYLEPRVQLDVPVNIHFTGCPHSCAQHYIGDIGLLGIKGKNRCEAYHVFVGGGFEKIKRSDVRSFKRSRSTNSTPSSKKSSSPSKKSGGSTNPSGLSPHDRTSTNCRRYFPIQ